MTSHRWPGCGFLELASDMSDVEIASDMSDSNLQSDPAALQPGQAPSSRPLPFGLRLDKWRCPPGATNKGSNIRIRPYNPVEAPFILSKISEHDDCCNPSLAPIAASRRLARPTHKTEGGLESEIEKQKHAVPALLVRSNSLRCMIDSLRSNSLRSFINSPAAEELGQPSPLQQLQAKQPDGLLPRSNSITSLKSMSSETSPMSPGSPMSRVSPLSRARRTTSALSSFMHSILRAKKASSSLSPHQHEDQALQKKKEDIEWVTNKMVEFLNHPENIMAHGMNETDAKILGKFCQHLRIGKAEIFVLADTPIEHVTTVLEGKLVAYHRKMKMETFGVGSHAGTLGIPEGAKYTFTLVAEEDTFVALLPYQKMLKYIQDLPVEREEVAMNFCFDVLILRNLESVHKRSVFDAAAKVQNSFRVHLARREFWRLRNRLQAPAANVIIKVWRGHRARKWLWIIAPEGANTIQRAYRCRLALRRFQKEQSLSEQKTRKVLRRWQVSPLTRGFMAWKNYILNLHDTEVNAKGLVKDLLYGEMYACFRKWADKIQRLGDIVNPKHSFPGKLVALSNDGRAHALVHGERLDGDTECGVLIEPLLSDKTVWRVRWLSSGKLGTYLTGSMGRFHLCNWNVDNKRSVANLSQDENQGFSAVRHALLNKQGVSVTASVNAPCGGTLTIPCPKSSPWNIVVTFPPRAVNVSVMITMQGIEAIAFEATKLTHGNIVSPVVRVGERHRRGGELSTDVLQRRVIPSDGNEFKVFRKPFTLVIPHRAVSTAIKSLALYYWPDTSSGSERITHDVSFDDNYCTAEVNLFGIFCVVATSNLVSEMVYAEVSFPTQRRHVTGKMITTVYMSSTFKGVVYMYPKAFLEAPEGLPTPTLMQWMTMARFPISRAIVINSVSVSFDNKMDGCQVTSWSGRAKWKGMALRMDFEGIVQPEAGKFYGEKEPVVICKCVLPEDSPDKKPVITFSGPYGFNLHIKSAILRVVLHTQGGHTEAYVRSLQSRETLLDIRKWVAKAWLVEKCSSANLEWFKFLRFVDRGTDEERSIEDGFVSLDREPLHPAGMFLPTVELRPVSKADNSYGTPEQIAKLDSIVRKELHVEYKGPRIFSTPPQETEALKPGSTTPLLGGRAILADPVSYNSVKSKIKPFGNCDALLFGKPWTAPHHKLPLAKGSKHGLGGGGKSRCQIASALLRTSQRALDTFCSFRTGSQPKILSDRKGIADQLYVVNNVVPRRPASARFHSVRQIESLKSKAQDIEHRLEQALLSQAVQAPGKTVEQRQSTAKSLISDMVGRLHLEIDGTVRYADAHVSNAGAPTARRRYFRPSSGKIPIPN